MAGRKCWGSVQEIMKSPGWKETVEVIGITAIVASLIFVGLELRQAQAVATSEMAAKLLVDDMEWVNLLNQNRDVWIKGNRGDPLNEIETSTYRDLSLVRQSLAFFRYRQLQNLGILGDVIVADFATHLHLNSGARAEWERRSAEFNKYGKPLVANRTPDIVQNDDAYVILVKTMLKELDEMHGPD